MAARLLLACHAGPGVGLGHLTRCLVAARALRRSLGASVQLLVQGEPLARDDLAAFPHRFLPADADLGAALDAHCQAEAIDVLLLDLQPQRVPPGLAQHLRDWRAAGRRVVAIDGLLAWRPLLDLIFLPAYRFEPPADLADGAPILFGWDCLLLDPLAATPPRPPGRNVLALTGGSDATGLGRHWPAALDAALPADARLHWVTGPFSPAPALPAAPRLAAIVEHRAPAGLGPLMAAADVAVTVFGVSCFELLQRGVPTVVFSPYGRKDDAELAGIAALDIALVARDEHDATRQLAALMQDPARAATLSRNARRQLHTPGGERLARALQDLLP